MPSEGLSPDCRLRKSADFEAVFKENTFRVSNRYMLLLAKENNLPYPRLGMVVAKKNVSKAVRRNRIKRSLRESFRYNRSQLTGYDLVVLCRSGIDKLDNGYLREALTDLWAQLICQSKKIR